MIDGVSWRILLQDFQTVYQQLSLQQPLQLPAKTSAFQTWAQKLQTYATSAELEQETGFWLEMLEQPPTMTPFSTAIAQPAMASASTVRVKLTQAETQTLLQEVPAAYNTQINDVLLTALVQAFREWTNQPWAEHASLLIDLEGHGREDLFPDVTISRTVGWFTAVYPVHLTVDTSDPGLALMNVKERLRQIPNHGIGYGLLRYGREQRAIAQLQSLQQPQVKFNYLGQFDQKIDQCTKDEINLVTAQESCGENRSLLGPRDHPLEIIGYVSEGTLHLEWICSGSLPPSKTIETLAQSFLSSLRSLIQHCQDPNTKGYTPSDFSEFQWSNWKQADLDKIQAAIGEN
ncbi:MAG: hypothetical protein DCF25_19585 [Leptolyngbya foveolarum]|uniref:Condensation domain-containing protein n=1 Tax=Leptolyngbya foveolarum TaxID=47253 RepID=A0A2W4TQ69_9CYAN|nr:MAG: hypothetical protein DCF25_19585 [Leptolyngbya foveolarum]